MGRVFLYTRKTKCTISGCFGEIVVGLGACGLDRCVHYSGPHQDGRRGTVQADYMGGVVADHLWC